MKKSRFFIPFALIGLVLAGCTSASALVDNFNDTDREIETPWQEYVMPASALEFAEGEESIELNKGDTHKYSYTISPRGATVNSISWFSNNQNVASVENGVVTAVGGGETTILASSADANFDPVELAVKVNVPLRDFSLDVPARLDWNERYEFDVTYDPEDTTYRELNYEIVNPSAEGVALVDGNAVTTGGVNGNATLRVSAGNISHDYPLVIQTIPVTGIALTGSADEVEVGHGIQVTATVSPSGASEFVKKGVKFYSRNPEIATVDESSGVITGVSAGTAHIFARVGSFESANDLVVTVYEVHATSVAINTPAFTLANSGEGSVLEKQLEWTITTDKAGVSEPSNAVITFASDNEEVATVNNSGLVTATGPGSANISINIAQEGRALVTASVAVTVNIVSTALTITGGTSFYNDESLTLTANLVPAKVSNEEITWSLEPATGVAVLSATTGKSVTLTPDNEDATGTVVVTATNTGGASNSVSITLAERTAEFTTGHHYIVGNHLYNTGESVTHATKTSWNSAKYAYHFTNRVNSTSSLEEYKGTIKFQVGDHFRYRVGNDYIDAWEQHEGWAEKGYHIENAGALADGSMKFVKEDQNHDIYDSDAADANIYVNEAGWYDLYAKQYKKEDGSSWYALYIQKVPAITVDLPELTMGPTDTYQIVTHDYIGALTYDSNDLTVATVNATGLITAVAVGTAVITVKDSRNSQAEVTVHVKDGATGVSKVIYLHANGLLDQGEPEAIPFVYSWKQVGESASNATSTKMTKVAGQTVIYEAEIPVDQNYVIFVNSKQNNFDWGQIHQQTVDLAIPDGQDMFKPTGTENEKVVGEWSVFDPGTTYTVDPVEIKAPYIFYKTTGDWVRKQLVTNPGNQAEVMGSVDLPVNGEFCVCLTDTLWLHFENLKSGSASQVVAGAENDDHTHNFKASAEGTYTLYVDKDSHQVYVAFEGDVPDPDPEVIKVYFADYLGWVSGPNTPKAYVWGGSYGAKAQWPGEDMTYVGLDVNSKKVYSYDVDVAKYANVIFFCGGYQTVDIALTAADNNGGYKAIDSQTGSGAYNVESYTYVPQGSTTYTVSFNSNGGSGEMDAATGISGSYTLPACGFTAPTNKQFAGWAYTADGAVITNASIDVSVEVTLYAIWEDIPAANNVTIHFTNSFRWHNVKAYVFNNETHAEKVAFPGEAMTRVGTNNQYQAIYSYTVDIDTYTGIIFTNGESGDANQSVDIDISSATDTTGYYLAGRVDDDESKKATIGQYIYEDSLLIDESELYFFTNNNNWPQIHAYRFNSTTDTGKTSWLDAPVMTWVGNNEYSQGIFVIQIDDLADYNAIIFRDTTTQQTVDILGL